MVFFSEIRPDRRRCYVAAVIQSRADLQHTRATQRLIKYRFVVVFELDNAPHGRPVSGWARC